MTTNLSLNQPAYNSSGWNVPLNSNEDILDAAFGATSSISLTNANVTLTSPTTGTPLGQTQAMRVRLTGSISANITVYWPASVSGMWIVTNNTTGSYTITLAVFGTGGTTVTAPQGYSIIMYSDGTNIALADNGNLTSANPTFTTVTTTGNATVGGDLAVTGNATITGNQTVSGTQTVTGNQTISGKTIPNVNSQTSITSPLAWNSNTYVEYAATAQANALTINADAGTPSDGQKMIFRFLDNGTARALTWTTGVSKGFRAVGATLPTTTTANKTTYVGCIYNAAASRWDAVAVVTEA